MIDLLSQITANVSPGPDYKPDADGAPAPVDPIVKLIAFYLPQFHRIPENDAIWGNGFTEWTNTTKAIPRFSGHYQPRLPGELGFYDLRSVSTLAAQATLAKRYGIHGFCFHYYWFDGRSLLHAPLKLLIKADIEIPFCINWANENWTRRWDGGDGDITVAQKHTPEDDVSFIRSLEPLVSHPRYIRIDGRPLILVYRPSLLPNPAETMGRWRQELERAKHGNPYLVMCHSFDHGDPRQYGMDAAVGFPPHKVGWSQPDIQDTLVKYDPEFAGQVKSYQGMADSACSLPPVDYPFFHTVCPAWDNQARQANRGVCFTGSTPEAYGVWLARACRRALMEQAGDERIVFINAWNEWAEGAYLEPDRHYGYAFLTETANVLNELNAVQNDSLAPLNVGEELRWSPDRLVPFHHWVGHIPFAFWLVKTLRPEVLVELGTHRGNSYCAFCQAITDLKINCSAFAVDEWRGDVHMNVDKTVLEELRAYHDPRYGGFSTLMPMNFDHARRPFSAGRVDLLHIDGTHTYEAVRHDFETWLPTLSDRAVVLFHDTNEHSENFGVWRFWKEVSAGYPHFEFLHSHGLGVLGVGRKLPEQISALFRMESDRSMAETVRSLFSAPGDLLVRRLLAEPAMPDSHSAGAVGSNDRDAFVTSRSHCASAPQ